MRLDLYSGMMVYLLSEEAPISILITAVEEAQIEYVTEGHEGTLTLPRPDADVLIREGCEAFLHSPAARLMESKRTQIQELIEQTPQPC